MIFGRSRSESLISQISFLQIISHLPEASFVSSHSKWKTAISRFKKHARLPAWHMHGVRERFTSKRKSKSFYFKIHHLQLSSKFVSPICRLHFSRHILVIDLNLYFLHALSLPLSLTLFLVNDERIPCSISGTQFFKYINKRLPATES